MSSRMAELLTDTDREDKACEFSVLLRRTITLKIIENAVISPRSCIDGFYFDSTFLLYV